MAIIEMEAMVNAGLDRAVELMALAAHNSFRFNDRNTVKIRMHIAKTHCRKCHK